MTWPPVAVTSIWICSLTPSTTLTSRTSNHFGLFTSTSALVDPQVTGALNDNAMLKYLACGLGTSWELLAPRVNWQLSGPVTSQKGRSVGLSTEFAAKLM